MNKEEEKQVKWLGNTIKWIVLPKVCFTLKGINKLGNTISIVLPKVLLGLLIVLLVHLKLYFRM